MGAYQQRTFAGTPESACIRFSNIVKVLEYQNKKFIVVWAPVLLYNDFHSPSIFVPKWDQKWNQTSCTNRHTERVQLILSAIQEDPQVTVHALVEDLGISKNTIFRILKELQENGTIKREGSSWKGRWVVL